MRVIIAGSRCLLDFSVVEAAIKNSEFKITEVVSGMCTGPDLLGERWAAIYNVPVIRFPADWNRYGRAAGPIRNKQMADHAQALIACYDGVSRGTASMIKLAREKNLKIY